MSSSDDERKSGLRRRVRANDLNAIGDNEIRALYKADLKYGDLTDLFESLIADGTLPVRSIDKYQEIYSDMLSIAQDIVSTEERKRNAILENLEKEAAEYRSKIKSGEINISNQEKDNPLSRQSAKKREKKVVLFEYMGVKSLNAETFVNRAQYLKVLKDYINKHFKEDPLKFTFGNIKQPKPVQNWSCNWNKEDDEKSIVGVYKYGYGSWNQIRDDPFLGLSDKIFLNDSQNTVKNKKRKPEKSLDSKESSISSVKKGKGITWSSKKVPGGIHLGRRTDYLITLLKDLVNTKDTIQYTNESANSQNNISSTLNSNSNNTNTVATSSGGNTTSNTSTAINVPSAIISNSSTDSVINPVVTVHNDTAAANININKSKNDLPTGSKRKRTRKLTNIKWR